jgi:hypothetical protein
LKLHVGIAWTCGSEWAIRGGVGRFADRLVLASIERATGEERQPSEAPGAWGRAFSDIEVAPTLTLGPGGPLNVVAGGDDNRTGACPFNAVYGQFLPPQPAFGRPLEAGMARQIRFDFEF